LQGTGGVTQGMGWGLINLEIEANINKSEEDEMLNRIIGIFRLDINWTLANIKG
jgi:hypothetical protein